MKRIFLWIAVFAFLASSAFGETRVDGGLIETYKRITVNGTSTTESVLLIDANGATGTTGQAAVRIDSELTDTAALYITSAVDGSGTSTVFDDYAAAIVSEGIGGCLSLYRDVASATGPMLYIFDDNADSAGASLVVRNDSDASGVEPAVTFWSTNAAFDVSTVVINRDTTTGATGQNALKIDSEDPDAAALYITSAVDGSGTSAIYDDFAFVAVSEGAGGAASFYRDVASANREIVKIYEDNPTAVGKVLRVYTDQNDSASSAMVDFQSTSSAYDQPVLEVTQAGTGQAVNLVGGVITGDEYSIAKQHDEIGILLDNLTAPVSITGFTGTGADSSTETGYESGAGRTWTYHGGLTTDKVFEGGTYVYSFDGTDSYLSTPDTADMSFGDGSSDSAFSIGGWIQVVASDATKIIASKWDSTTGSELREWSISVDDAEQLVIELYDESANARGYRVSDGAISEGWHHFIITYDGTGGATCLTGTACAMYIDGVAVSMQAAGYNGTYVAMENLATDVFIGARTDTSAIGSFFQGDMGRPFVTPEELSAGTVWKLYEKTRGFYNK